jgi:hypothetical protein
MLIVIIIVGSLCCIVLIGLAIYKVVAKKTIVEDHNDADHASNNAMIGTATGDYGALQLANDNYNSSSLRDNNDVYAHGDIHI